MSEIPEGYIIVPAPAWHELVQYELRCQEMAAQVEALKISDSELHALAEDLIDHLRYNKRESTDALEVYWDRLSAIQTTQISPQQHLAEIRAQAVEQFALHVSDNMDDGIDRAKLIILASERIYSIRRGEVE